MSTKTYTVQDLARLGRVTVRTLHHYDAIGLLPCSERTLSGYRLYEAEPHSSGTVFSSPAKHALLLEIQARR
jgi:hypothetical protein